MNIESLRAYCLSIHAVTEDFPFDEDVLVFRVAGKIFLLTSITKKPLQFNVKADPDTIIEMREQFDCVIAGYHMNKKHWNSVVVDGSVSDKKLQEWIKQSYDCIVAGLPKKERAKLDQ